MPLHSTCLEAATSATADATQMMMQAEPSCRSLQQAMMDCVIKRLPAIKCLPAWQVTLPRETQT